MRGIVYRIRMAVLIFLGVHISMHAQGLDASRHSDFQSGTQDSVCVVEGEKVLYRHTLRHLPFRGESQEYYALFPGVVNQDYQGTNYLHVRGSRHDEIAYSVEGIDVRNAYTGMSMFRIIPEALDRIILDTGPGASASHASVILGHRLRRGGKHYRFSLQSESDGFTSEYEKRLGTYSYGYTDMVATAEGKIVTENVRFFAAGEWQRFGDHYRKFWDGLTVGPPEFEMVDYWRGTPLQEIAGTDQIVIRPGNIPEAGSDRVSVNGIVTADIEPFQFRLIGLYDWSKKQMNDTPIMDVFNPRRIPVFEERAGLLSLQADYASMDAWKAHVQLDVMRSNNKTYDPLFEDDFLLYRDSLAVTAQGLPWGNPDQWSGQTYYSDPPGFNLFDFDFTAPGALLTEYSKSAENYWAVSGRVEKTWNGHRIALGGSLQKRTLRKYAMGYSFNFMELYDGTGAGEASDDDMYLSSLRRWGNVRAYGYDVFGNPVEKTDIVNDGPRHPSLYTLFLEDQFRAKDFRVDVGLRYDRFSSDAYYIEDPDDVEYDDWGYISYESYEKPSSNDYWSPRLRLVYVGSHRFMPYLNVGQYVQQPRFRDVYASRNYYENWDFSWYGHDIKGPRARPVRVSQTELGFSYRAGSGIHIESALFYKTIDGHLEMGRILHETSPYHYTHLSLINSGETTAKGWELSVEYRKRGFYAWMNYSLSDVKGYASYPRSIASYFDSYSDDIDPKTEPPAPLEFNQRHRINALMGYRFDENAPGWLRYSGASLLFRFNSGHDYTLYQVGGFGCSGYYSLGMWYWSAGDEIGMSTTPWNYQLDIRLDKTIRVGRLAFTAYIYVHNLLNRKNAQHVYPATGDTSDDGSYPTTSRWRSYAQQLFGDGFFTLYDQINIGHRQHYQIVNGGDLFGHPREIRFGLRIGFSTDE